MGSRSIIGMRRNRLCYPVFEDASIWSRKQYIFLGGNMANVLETKQKIEDTKVLSNDVATMASSGIVLGNQLIAKINSLRTGGGATQDELDEIFGLAVESYNLVLQNRDAMVLLIGKLNEAMTA